MKRILLLVLFTSTVALAQFRSDLDKPADIKSSITNYTPSGFLLGFINPQNFNMQHSVSMSYSTFGGHGIALGVYTNNMSYQFSDNLNIEADISFVNSPYSSFGENHAKSLNGIYLSRAQLNYQPWKDFKVTFQYLSLPPGYYGGYNYYSPLGRLSNFY
ncbi:MAG: hypothetical protein JW995_10900 [Melioribacteraceae bacterium]|nr:hypothetical protein [Melioribacteraceae bacterium]